MNACWWTHTWGKWEQYNEEWVKIDKRTEKEYFYLKDFQKRYCEICNKLQIQSIR